MRFTRNCIKEYFCKEKEVSETIPHSNSVANLSKWLFRWKTSVPIRLKLPGPKS